MLPQMKGLKMKKTRQQIEDQKTINAYNEAAMKAAAQGDHEKSRRLAKAGYDFMMSLR